MSGVIQFALLGFGISAVYTLLSQGLVLIYRGSGVLNFAHAGLSMLAAFLFYSLHIRSGWAGLPAAIVVIAAVTVLGVVFYRFFMRPLRNASMVARAIVTLGLLILLQGAAVLIWGTTPLSVASSLPTHVVHLGSINVGLDRLLLLAIAVVLTVVLWAWSRFTATGLALRAASESTRGVATLGWSPDRMGVITWGVGSALAALAGVLIAPLTGVDTTDLPLLVIPVLAAALLGRLRSYPLTLLASLVIGVAQSEFDKYVNVNGLSTAAPFAVIIGVLIVTGQGLPGRSFVSERLPALGSGRIRIVPVAVITVVLALLIIYWFPFPLINSLTVLFAWGVIMLSVVVLLGYTGQLSLAQYAIGGVAALIAGRLVQYSHLSFLLSLVIATALTMIFGLLVALPALRTRGIDLAVVTLGVSVALTAMVFSSTSLTGGVDGLSTGAPTVFGIDVNPLTVPERYCTVVLVALVLAGLMVANLRRGTAGRRLIAVRTNERAAAALGISVFGQKLYAFTVAAGIAGVGGVLLAFQNSAIVFTNYTPLESILSVVYAILGGVGFVIGGPMGATLVAGSLGTWILDQFAPNASSGWLSVLGGLTVMVLMVFNQDGLVGEQIRQINLVKEWWRRRTGRTGAAGGSRLSRLLRRGDRGADPTPGLPAPVAPAALSVHDVVVRFGGVTAVDHASLEVRTGEVVGLIGPNGAGKTTLIDVITGFTRPREGRVVLNDERIEELPAHKRARRGVGRSFQSLELFEHTTVRDNLVAACDDHSRTPFLRDLVAPRQPRLTPEAMTIVTDLGLTEQLEVATEELSYGSRRQAAIARTLVSRPSIVLLDEPAAGLSGGESDELRRVVRHLVDELRMGVLLVEHDMPFVMDVCDRIVVLDFGRVIASGTPQEIAADPRVIAAYLGADEPETAARGEVPATVTEEHR